MVSTRTRLCRWPRQALNWLCGGRADYRAFQARRASRAYRANRSLCLLVWGAAAALLLLCGGAGCLLLLLLTATLLCFALLDPD
ncbi:MAG: hypothetical protein EA400_11090 [Chromatiaceae bacterium]|nr:MAG: hypothetical protein EA400_11090 [Chromatiaceae bacterium]